MRSGRSSQVLPHQSDTRPRGLPTNRVHIGTLDETSPLTFGIRLLIRRQFLIVAADCLDPSEKSSYSRGSKWPGLTTVPITPPMFIGHSVISMPRSAAARRHAAATVHSHVLDWFKPRCDDSEAIRGDELPHSFSIKVNCLQTRLLGQVRRGGTVPIHREFFSQTW